MKTEIRNPSGFMPFELVFSIETQEDLDDITTMIGTYSPRPGRRQATDALYEKLQDRGGKSRTR